MKIIIKTDDLIVREFSEQDAFPLAIVLTHAASMNFSPQYSFATIQKTHEMVQAICDSYKKNGWGLWALVDQDDDALVGLCGLVARELDGEQVIVLEHCLMPDYFQQDVIMQLVYAISGYVFNVLGVGSFIYLVNTDNNIANNVVQELGMVPWKKAVWCNNYIYMYDVSTHNKLV